MRNRAQGSRNENRIERVANERAPGSWNVREWLIARDQTRVERGMLIGDTVDAHRALSVLGSEPRRIRADRFALHRPSGWR